MLMRGQVARRWKSSSAQGYSQSSKFLRIKVLTMTTAITVAALFTPLKRMENPVVLIEDGVISAIGAQGELEIPENARRLDFPDAILAPGFIDVHIHGGGGFDVMQAGDDPAALAAIEALLARHGVTSYCPTTVTAGVDATLKSLEALGEAIRKPAHEASDGEAARARPLGIHLEGPFISTEKCGVHPVKDIQRPSLELFERFWQAAQGAIKVMTIAPELPGAEELIHEASKRGVRVSVGHSNANTAATKAAAVAGATHATHTFNAMRPLDHREPGILGVVLADQRFTADIIADGVHVAPEVLKLFLAAKGAERAVLITDAISATGMGDGRYRLGTFEVEVRGDKCLLNGKLAGSVLTMDRAIRNVMQFAEWRLQEIVRLATINPARVLRVDERKGSLAVGKDADMVVLTPEGGVVRTIVGGRV